MSLALYSKYILYLVLNDDNFAGDTIHQVININWEPVMRDIGPAAFQQIIKACVDEAKKLFAAVPLNQLLLP